MTRFLLAFFLTGTQLCFSQTWNRANNTGTTVMGQTSAAKTVVTPGGDVYVLGEKIGAVSFGTTTPPGEGLDDVFIARYSSNGTLLWVQTIGGAKDERALALSTDGNGNAYVAINYESPSILINGTEYTNAGGDSVFPGVGTFSDALVAKIDFAGNWQWAVSIGTFGDDALGDMVTDAAGRVYLAGQLAANGNVGGLPVPASKAYVVKLDSAGTGQWVATGGSVGNFQNAVYGLAINPQGTQLALTGSFGNSALFGTISLQSPFTGGDYQAYVATLNTNTGTWIWATQAGGDDGDEGSSLVMDAAGNVVFAGAFVSSHFLIGTFDLPFYEQPTTSFGHNGFVAKLDPTGQVLWAAAANSPNLNDITDLELTGDGDIYVAGIAEDSAFFGTNTLTWTYDYNPYVARIDGNSGIWQWAIAANEISGCGCGHLATTQIDLSVGAVGQLSVVSRYTDSLRVGPHKLIGPLFFSQGSGQTQGYVLGLGDQMPVVTSIEPGSGTIGTDILINGQRLGTASSVTVNGIPATFVVNSTNSISVTTPAGASSGLIRIVTPDGKANSPVVFQVEGTTGVQNIAGNGISFGPNPAQNQVTIILPNASSGKRIWLVDGLGRTVYSRLVTTGQTETSIPLDGISRGLYTIKLEDASFRLVVN